LAQDTGASGSERMAERYTTTIWVHPFAWEGAEGVVDARLFADKIFVLQTLDMAEHLRRKRFVNLPQRYVVELQPAPGQNRRYGGHGRHQQAFGEDVNGGYLEIDETNARRRRRKPR